MGLMEVRLVRVDKVPLLNDSKIREWNLMILIVRKQFDSVN